MSSSVCHDKICTHEISAMYHDAELCKYEEARASLNGGGGIHGVRENACIF